MPLPEDVPRRRSGNDAKGRSQNIDSKSPGLPVTKTVACGLIFVVLICVWQFILLTHHVEPQLNGFGTSGGSAMLRLLEMEGANISALNAQQHELVRLVAQLGSELRQQHNELSDVQGLLRKSHLDTSNSRSKENDIAQLQAKIFELENRARNENQAAAQQSSNAFPAPSPGRPSPSPAFASTLDDASAGPSNGRWPAWWLEKFSEAEIEASAREAEKWLSKTKDVMKHTWDGYRLKAWGKDEMKPQSGSAGRVWGNMGLQILDALTTLWVMDMKDEFDEAAKWVEDHLTFKNAGMVSFFEITIRALGGLCGAHSLSQREIFLTKAKELADRMLPAFSDQPGFPHTQVNLNTGQGVQGWYRGTILAEAGTVQLEFRYVSQQTGDPKYQQKADTAMKAIITAAKGRGLVPWGLNLQGPPHFQNTHITFGAMGDSYYEYLLKMYLQTSKTENVWKEAWKQAMHEMKEQLVLKTQGGLTYIAEKNNGVVSHKMDHLACFAGGMLILGARTLPTDEVDSEWEHLGGEIAETCYQMYARQPSHLGPECSAFRNSAHDNDMQIWNGAAHYLLRPETAEAIFYMFYWTGNPKYRRMAGMIIDAIEDHCKTTFGYSAVSDVRSIRPSQKNEMETFFIAETLKYLYLTFVPNPREVVDLDKFVFTTEAHPIKVFKPNGR